MNTTWHEIAQTNPKQTLAMLGHIYCVGVFKLALLHSSTMFNLNVQRLGYDWDPTVVTGEASPLGIHAERILGQSPE